MQHAPKKLKTDGAMTRDDWDFWENEVVHGAAGQVHLVKGATPRWRALFTFLGAASEFAVGDL